MHNCIQADIALRISHLVQFMRETNFKEREKLRLLITVTVISPTRTTERTGDRL